MVVAFHCNHLLNDSMPHAGTLEVFSAAPIHSPSVPLRRIECHKPVEGSSIGPAHLLLLKITHTQSSNCVIDGMRTELCLS